MSRGLASKKVETSTAIMRLVRGNVPTFDTPLSSAGINEARYEYIAHLEQIQKGLQAHSGNSQTGPLALLRFSQLSQSKNAVMNEPSKGTLLTGLAHSCTEFVLQQKLSLKALSPTSNENCELKSSTPTKRKVQSVANPIQNLQAGKRRSRNDFDVIVELDENTCEGESIQSKCKPIIIKEASQENGSLKSIAPPTYSTPSIMSYCALNTVIRASIRKAAESLSSRKKMRIKTLKPENLSPKSISLTDSSIPLNYPRQDGLRANACIKGNNRVEKELNLETTTKSNVGSSTSFLLTHQSNDLNKEKKSEINAATVTNSESVTAPRLELKSIPLTKFPIPMSQHESKAYHFRLRTEERQKRNDAAKEMMDSHRILLSANKPKRVGIVENSSSDSRFVKQSGAKTLAASQNQLVATDRKTKKISNNKCLQKLKKFKNIDVPQEVEPSLKTEVRMQNNVRPSDTKLKHPARWPDKLKQGKTSKAISEMNENDPIVSNSFFKCPDFNILYN